MMIKDPGFSISLFSDVGDKQTAGCTESAAKSAKVSASSADSSVQSGRADRIEISSQAAESSHVLSGIKSDLLSEIGRDTDPEKLANLQESIRSGSYTVDAGTMSNLLLSDEPAQP